jgi:hypothetical protein
MPRSGWYGYVPSRFEHRPWNDGSWLPPAAEPPRPGVPVKLMPDYAAELPLWHYHWWDLNLPPELLNELADWQQAFDANFDPFKGWSSQGAKLEWAAEGERLIEKVRTALPTGFTVEVDLWPLDAD